MRLKNDKADNDNIEIAVIARPQKGQPSNPGIISIALLDGSQKIIPVDQLSDIRTGVALGDSLRAEFGIRAMGINLSFTAEETIYYFRTDVPQFLKLLHMARQGYSFDTSQLLRQGYERRDLNPTKSHEIGKMVEDKGIYLGPIEPDRSAKQLFNMFAAPEDLAHSDLSNNYFDFEDIKYAMSRLENWHGHDGSDIAPNGKINWSDQDELSKWRFFRAAYNQSSMQDLLVRENPLEGNGDIRYVLSDDNWSDYFSVRLKRETYNQEKLAGRVRPVRFEPLAMPALPKIY